jgi:hypothetical protein
MPPLPVSEAARVLGQRRFVKIDAEIARLKTDGTLVARVLEKLAQSDYPGSTAGAGGAKLAGR